MQVCPAAHARPHAPQFADVESDASQPLAKPPSQSAVPGAHAGATVKLTAGDTTVRAPPFTTATMAA